MRPTSPFFLKTAYPKNEDVLSLKKWKGFKLPNWIYFFLFYSLFPTLFIKISILDQDRNVRRDLKYKMVSIPLFRPKVDIILS